jgi:Spy/CpxP family protein refolding chaperone
MKLNKLALIVAVAAIACSAFAQGGGGGGRRGGGQRGGGSPYAPLTLAGREEVAKEIGITDDQKTKITELRTSSRAKATEAMQAAGTDRAAQAEARAKINADTNKALAEILKPEQMKRLRELEIQWSGKAIVTTDKELQSELGITDEQKTKFTDLVAKQRAAMAEARTATAGDRAAMTEATTKNNKIMEDEIDKVLTDAQKTKLKDLGGKEMAKPAPPARGGGGRRGGF